MLHALLARVIVAAAVGAGFASSGPISGASSTRLLAPVVSRDEARVCFTEEFRGVLGSKDQPKGLAPLFEQGARTAGGRVRP